MNDFGKLTIAALAKRGIRLVGLTSIPDMSSPMPFANAERGYLVDDNGTGRVWSFQQVSDAAAGLVP